MNGLGDRLLVDGPRRSIARYRPFVFLLIPLAAILFEVYVERLVEPIVFLELPLLVTVYFSLMRRSPVTGLLLGAGIGLMQDSLSQHPLGMFGISKTLAGYFASTVSQRFAVDSIAIRFLLALLFYLLHQILYWALLRALLGQPGSFEPLRELVQGLLNASVAIPLFHLLDKLRD